MILNNFFQALASFRESIFVKFLDPEKYQNAGLAGPVMMFGIMLLLSALMVFCMYLLFHLLMKPLSEESSANSGRRHAIFPLMAVFICITCLLVFVL